MKIRLSSIIVILFLLFCNYCTAQIGIGTTSPDAQLTINTGTSNKAPLSLGNLSTAPSSTLSAGQIAMIDNELYHYDDSRKKWLSMTTMPLTYSKDGATTEEILFFGGKVANANSQAILPFKGTIVHISAVCSRSTGTEAKRFNIRIRTNQTTTDNYNFSLNNNTYNNTNVDKDFEAGDVITVRARNSGSTVSNPTVMIWVKWRK